MDYREGADVQNDQDDYYDDCDAVSQSDDLGGVGTTTTELINLSTDYQPNWGGKEAFREFFQNFKDGILRSFNIAEHDFKPEVDESVNNVTIRVFHPEQKEPDKSRLLCGYIRFCHDHNSLGVLEITNFKSKLQRSHLGFGGTSKADASDQAGHHGEGLKLAALIMRRHPQNYSVRIQSSKFLWRFSFNKHMNLVCTLTRLDQKKFFEAKAQDQKREKSGIARKLHANAWEDVSVIIGESHRCRNLAGELRLSSKIPLQTFKQWWSLTLDITPPSHIIKTSKGDILLDTAYSNKIYLHGLLLGRPGSSAIFKFGYNFLEGETNRDRETSGLSKTENQARALMWSEALTGHSMEFPNLIDDYLQLFEDSQKHQDACQAKEYLTMQAVKALHDRMKFSHRDLFTVPFFHKPSQSKDIPTMHRLKYTPIEISADLWDLFEKHHMCQPIEKAWSEKFARRQTKLPRTKFAINLHRAVKACLQLLPSASNVPMDISFATVEGIKFAPRRTELSWMINSNYMSYADTHREGLCAASFRRLSDDDDLFICDHSVVYIFDSILRCLEDSDPEIFKFIDADVLSRIATRKLRLMPRAVRVTASSDRSIATVSWTSVASLWEADESVRISMHATDCHRFPYLTKPGPLLFNQNGGKCNCHTMFSKHSAGKVTFSSLSRKKTYLVMASHDENNAFIAAPPPTACLKDMLVSEEAIENRPNTLFQDVSDLFLPAQQNNKGSRGSAPSTENLAIQNLSSKDLPWDHGFPGAYKWIKAGKANSHLLLAKPKEDSVPGNSNPTPKRKGGANDNGSNEGAKKSRLGNTRTDIDSYRPSG